MRCDSGLGSTGRFLSPESCRHTGGLPGLLCRPGCKHGLQPGKVLPPLFVQYRNTKDPKKNSDIVKDGIESDSNLGILNSARKNVVNWYFRSCFLDINGKGCVRG